MECEDDNLDSGGGDGQVKNGDQGCECTLFRDSVRGRNSQSWPCVGLGLVISAPEAMLHPWPSWLSELESWRPKWEEQLTCDQAVDQVEGQWWRQCEEWFWLPLVSQGLPVPL